MFNKIHIGIFMAAGMLLAASCSNEDLETVLPDEEVQVTFSLGLETDTRAISDGSNINSLVVGVFDEGLTKEVARSVFTVENGVFADVTLPLGKDQTYNLVFWAYDSGCGVYNIDDLSAIEMTGGTSSTLTAAACADAFFATVKSFTATGSSAWSVTLTRPLAQINVGTSGEVSAATLTVEGAANVFNPFDGSVSGSENLAWTFDGTETETLTVDGSEYKYLAMAYVFAAGTETQASCELTVGSSTNEITGVTISANYRSNIVGAITGSGLDVGAVGGEGEGVGEDD